MSNTHLQDQISQFDLHDLLVTNEEFEIQDMGDYVIVDNIFKDPDAALKGLLKFPADSSDEVKRLMYQNEETPKFKTPNGVIQLFTNQYFDNWFQELYKILIEAEFVPHQVNTYLEDPQYMSSLSRSGLVSAQLQHDNMTIHKRANWPSPLLDFEYACTVFLGDNIDPDNGISFYHLLYNDTRYKTIEDLKDIRDRETMEAIKDYLNVFVTVQPDLEPYQPYEKTKYYDKHRFVEAKKNRMVIYKSGQWITDDYNNKGERYTFTTSIVVSKHQQQGELGGDPTQNKYTPSPSNFNDESLNEYTMNRPPEEPQQWDSDY